MTRHARQVHNGPKPLACPYCQYKTADRSNFKKHVELHLNPRQFHCPLCKYAASKKCNLQYHIKSRHVGCDIPIDVSKVKLRARKGGESNKVRSEDDDDDNDGDGFESEAEEYASKPAPAQIAASAKKSAGPGAAMATGDGEAERVQRKAKTTTTAAVKDKGSLAGKEKAVRKVTTRQKKAARASEDAKEKCTEEEEEGPAETPAVPPRSRDPKAKRSSRKKPPKEKPCLQEDASTAAEPRAEPSEEQVVLQQSMEEMKKLQKEKRMEKVKKAKQDGDTPKADVKAKKRLQSRRTGAKKPGRESEKPAEDVSAGNVPEEMPEVEKQAPKVKVEKRKATEALDLSTKHSSAAAPAAGSPGPKRCKTSAATKPSPPKTSPPPEKDLPEKDLPLKEEAPVPAKLKKTRKTNKKTPVLQEAAASAKDQQDSVAGDTPTATTAVQSSSPEVRSDATRPPPDTSDVQKLTKPRPAQPREEPAAQETTPQETTPQETTPQETTPQETAPQETTAPPAPETTSAAEEGLAATDDAPTSVRRWCEETPPCPAADRPAAPTFRRPGAKAPRPSLELPRPVAAAAAEEDEGIHSSHEGASDASDCASEGGSEDSGLNSAGAGSGKMPNDPETPTDEIPTPTELKCHLCVFCDRTFPLEVEYRRHVNRHLVNVYYMDSPAAKAAGK